MNKLLIFEPTYYTISIAIIMDFIIYPYLKAKVSLVMQKTD